jgi:zinc transport system permease protein
VSTFPLIFAASGPEWLSGLLRQVSDWFEPGSFLSFDFNLRGMIAIALVGLICGAVGSLVVGNRMAFFSDALAHCAFAGIGLGLLLNLLMGVNEQDVFVQYALLMMIAFGLVVGVGIAFVRDFTGLANDTVIGVFFAGAMGFGAIFLKAASLRNYLPPEDFLFGNLITVEPLDLLVLAGLAVAGAVVLALMYNQLLLAHFNRSLALSRRVRVRLCNYVFIVLLALIINVSIKAVGALLITALLIVPAATAFNVCRNMRQLFWFSTVMCLGVGVVGHYLSWLIELPGPDRSQPFRLGESGTIIVLAVLLFALSMVAGPWLRNRRKGGLPATEVAPQEGAE